MPDFRLISADSHINEPPDLWQSRVTANLRDRVPRVESLPQGDAWICEGALDPINFGMNQCGGLPREQQRAWVRWSEVRPGGYDPKARLPEQDVDGVGVEILYPTPRLSQAVFWNRADPELHLAMIRAYNDWLAEFCAYDPERLIGVALMPNAGVQMAVEELQRIVRKPGMRGVTIGQYPHGGVTLSAEDDPFWAAAQELNVPVAIHVSLVEQPPGEHGRTKFSGEFRFFDGPIRASEFINQQVFDRFPRLQLVLAETDCGWVPYVKEQMDDRFRRKDHAPLRQLPSAYFEQNISFTYITDSQAIRERKFIGVDRILWSSDFPHSGTDWPHSWDTIERHFAGVPEAEKHQILAGNAARLYGLTTPG